jgi:hypothetical protein
MDRLRRRRIQTSKICYLCQRRFATQYSLERHMRRAHQGIGGALVIQCDLCGRHFLTRNHLVEHLRAHVSPANRFNIVRHWFDRSVLRYQTLFVGDIESKESILQAVNFVYEDLRELLLLHVSWFRTLKVSMAASCVMVHDDWQPQGNAQVPAYVNKYFVSWCPYPTQVLLGIDDVDMFLNAGMHFMQELLERTTVDRSNVSLCHVRSLHLDLFRIRLIAGHCSNNVACIETLKDLSKPPPPSMRERRPKSDCFLNAVASMFVDEEDRNNVSALRNMARRRLTYNPRDMPMTLQQLRTFEEAQDFPIAINVYSIEKTVKKMRNDGGEQANSRTTNYSLSILHRSGNIAPGVPICNLLLLRLTTEQIRVARTGHLRAGSVKLHFVRMASLSKCVRPVYRGDNARMEQQASRSFLQQLPVSSASPGRRVSRHVGRGTEASHGRTHRAARACVFPESGPETGDA